MDVCYCKAELSWIASIIKEAQDSVNKENFELATVQLDFIERAISRLRVELKKGRLA